MPSTRTLNNDERLLADAWIKCAKQKTIQSYREKTGRYHHPHSYSLGRLHNSLRDAVCRTVSGSKYEYAFKYVLMLPHCRARKQRTVTTPISPQGSALKKLMNSWMKDDAGEQTDTWRRLKQALEENRSSDRKLFS